MRRPPESSINLVVSLKKVIADQREALASFKLLPPGKDFDFLVVPPNKVTADQREAPHRMCFPPFSNRRIALLPFALLVELLAPVLVGVLNSKRVLPSQYRTRVSVSGDLRSAARSQSPELGDGLPTTFLRCCRPGPTVSQRLVDFAGDPQPVQQNP
jgi:hypothetical protein